MTTKEVILFSLHGVYGGCVWRVSMEGLYGGCVYRMYIESIMEGVCGGYV